MTAPEALFVPTGTKITAAAAAGKYAKQIWLPSQSCCIFFLFYSLLGSAAKAPFLCSIDFFSFMQTLIQFIIAFISTAVTIPIRAHLTVMVPTVTAALTAVAMVALEAVVLAAVMDKPVVAVMASMTLSFPMRVSPTSPSLRRISTLSILTSPLAAMLKLPNIARKEIFMLPATTCPSL